MIPVALSDFDLLELLAIEEARESYWAFYRYMNPGFATGWFQKEVAENLQTFYDELIAGGRPKYVIEAPPQHGKSKMIVTFIAWLSGKNPDLKTIYTSFSERLGIRANLLMQRMLDSDRYKKVFNSTKINAPGISHSDSSNATRSRELLEFIGKGGFFRNTTVRGSITGESLDLGVIDDPIKGREDANSEAVRNKTWDWFTDDFFTRFAEDAGLLSILTRWHIDDPIGRLKEAMPGKIKVFSYSAISVQDEKHRKTGEPLFPKLKSLEFLLERKQIMTLKYGSKSWESLYQQNPRIEEGQMIKRVWIKRYKTAPDPRNIIRIIQSWDTANKVGELNDPSVCTTWVETQAGYFLIDVYKERLEYPDLKRAIISKYNQFRPNSVLIEDKASGQQAIQELKRDTRIPIIAIEPEGDKVMRMNGASGSFESGIVYLPEEADWLLEYETELFAFPEVKHDDQCDSTSQFIKWLNQKQRILIG